jgi:hypothetical protein
MSGSPQLPLDLLPEHINYPGHHDFVVVASDGVRFNLSRAVLAITSGFFADMLTVGERSSSTQSSEEQTVNAPENISSSMRSLLSHTRIQRSQSQTL